MLCKALGARILPAVAALIVLACTSLAALGQDAQPPAASAPPSSATPPAAPTNPAVGSVATVTGTCTDFRNGAPVTTLKAGDAIFKGDLLQTDANGALAVTFDDETTFRLGPSATLEVSEFLFEEGGSKNSALFNVVRGSAAFVANLVAKTGDMKISTPTTTLGIRGTTGLVDVPGGGGDVSVKLYPDANGRVGRIELFGTGGAQLGTLSRGATGFSIRPGAAGRFAAVPLQISPQQAARDRSFVQQTFAAQRVGRQMIIQRRSQQPGQQRQPNLQRPGQPNRQGQPGQPGRPGQPNRTGPQNPAPGRQGQTNRPGQQATPGQPGRPGQATPARPQTTQPNRQGQQTPTGQQRSPQPGQQPGQTGQGTPTPGQPNTQQSTQGQPGQQSQPNLQGTPNQRRTATPARGPAQKRAATPKPARPKKGGQQ